jgi:alginate O-acetyltransferase complex protein AlgI
MLFNTLQFFLFLIAALALFYAAPVRWRRLILLAASYFFYMSFIPKYVLVLVALTAIDYTVAIGIERATSRRSRKLLLILSLSANLGLLGFFKYFNFLTGNAFALHIALPLGISFHTFQSIAYVVDVYRGDQAAVTNPIDYALFIAFFPQLVSGPIVRAHNFFADLYKWAPPKPAEVSHGALLLLLGLAKKVALADQFARIAAGYFSNPRSQPGGVAAWSGVFAFGMQIYFDFSGYTDMAIGMAELLGFHFPVNFRRPYLASSLTDFWRRWHISLSTWLRDYLYFPLGANRRSELQGYRNLMITMLLGGLWHGASWNFVIWGGYHGALLCLERLAGLARWKSVAMYPLRAVVTFGLVLIGWVFFRAATLHDSRYVIGQMFSGGGSWLVPVWLMVLIGMCLLLAALEEKGQWFEKLACGPAWAYACAGALLLLCVDLIGVTDVAVPFVYFQF